MINKISALDTFNKDIAALTAFGAGSAAKHTTFQDLFQHWIKAASESEIKAQSLAHQFSMGAQDLSIHQVMIAAQKSLITIKASTEVTKRCLNAYQEIWNMPL